MKPETSQDLLNRLRAKKGASWYGLAKLLGAHTNTIYSWKAGHTVVDRKFAPRLAELLDEPAEYVLAVIEAEREQHADVLKVWRRIAERFRSSASILLVGLVLFTAHRNAGANVLDVELSWDLSNCPSIHYAQFRAYLTRLLRKLMRCLHLGLKSHCAAPLPGPWAGIRWKRSPASAPRSWRTSPVCT